MGQQRRDGGGGGQGGSVKKIMKEISFLKTLPAVFEHYNNFAGSNDHIEDRYMPNRAVTLTQQSVLSQIQILTKQFLGRRGTPLYIGQLYTKCLHTKIS